MKILRLRLSNLNSLYGVVEIDFTQPPFTNMGLFAIVGDTGAGKTTILDAITLAIYGKVHRYKKEKTEMIASFGTQDAGATVEFEAQDKTYRAQWLLQTRIKRDKTTETKTVRTFSDITDDNEIILSTNVREIDAMVANACGLTFEQFTKSVLLAQGDFAAFLKAEERERSELLEQITGSEIYTTLGIKTFEQHRTYKHALEVKEAEYRGLQLLSDTEMEALQKELSDLQSEQSSRQTALEQLQQGAKIWQNHTTLTQKWAKLELQANDLAKAEDDFAKQYDRLQAHEQALPFQAQLMEINMIAQEISKKTTAQTAAEKSIKTLDNSVNEAQTATETSEQHWSNAKDAHQNTMQTVVKVRDLDTKIAERLQPLQQWQQNFDTCNKSHKAAHKDLKIKTETIERIAKKINESEQWLSENSHWQHLTSDLKNIEFALLHGKAAYQKVSILRENFRKKNQELAATQTEAKAIEADLGTLYAQQLELKESLKAFENQGFRVQDDFVQQHDFLKRKIQYANEFLELKSNYDRLLETNEQQKDDLETAQNTLNVHYRQILTRHEEVEHFHETTHDRYLKLSGLQLMQSHEEARSQLKTGEPCPLCGALTHPYALQTVANDVLVRAENDWLNAKNKLEASQQKLKNCEMIIHRTIPIIQNIEDKMYQTRLDIVRYEMNLGQILGYIGEDLNLRDPETMTAKKAEWEQTCATLLAEKQVFMTKKDDLQANYQSIITKKSNLEVCIARYDTIESALESLKQEGTTNRALLDEQTAIITQITQKMGIESDFDWENAEQIWVEWQQKSKEYLTHQTELETQYQQQKIAQIEYQNAKENSENLEKSRAELATQGDTLKAALQTLQTERQTLLGDASTDDVQKKADDDLRQAQNNYEKHQKHLHALLQQRSTEQELCKQLMRDLADKHAQQEAIVADLTNEITTKQLFEDIDALKSALLSDKLAAALQTEQQDLTQRKAILDNTKAQLEQEKTEIDAQIATIEAADVLTEKIKTIQQTNKAAQQRIGVIQFQIEQQDKRKLQAQTIEEELHNLTLNTRRWDALNKLIGDAKGVKFRTFAQSLTLQRLVNLANQHLKTLNPRYLIRKDAAADLNILIQDTYQANFERSMQTLSGGESFLVSLALALGLSDMAGNNTRIESLFIDEGFGTLDPDSLNSALAALEALQLSGKLIGIISHVPELKERISVKVNVIKQSGGRSKVVVV